MMPHQTYKISGVPVLFPGRPYPSQFSMMDRIIKGIERRQHCLLESPTGSGKSLALLCSSLAWLLDEKAKKDEEDQKEVDKGMCVCTCHVPGITTKSDSPPVDPKLDNTVGIDESIVINDDDDDDEFKKDLVNFNTKSSDKKIARKHISIAYETDEKKSTKENENQDCQKCSCSTTGPVHRKIPKIFFGTRTHKQVAQIVRELRKTEYKDINMTILGSREHTCIHPSVSKMKSKNEGCKELLNGPGCHFKDKSQRYMSHQVIKGQGLPSAWDLEDLVGLCKTKKICPYFLSRGLKEEADLVICPYNYLVDPLIREAMSLSLKGHVIILDEAHNIEDSAREAASQTIPQESITSAVKDMDVLMQSHNLADYSRLVHVLRKLDTFIDDNKHSLEQKDFNQSYKIWNGFHIVAQLETMGMGPKHFPDLKKALAQIKMDAEERKEETIRKGLPDEEEMKPVTITLMEQLFMVMDFMYRQDLKYVDDYRASLVHSINYVPRYEENQWLSSRNRNGGRNMVQVDVLNLNFWCMNPAVAFSDFVETRSVILTSGTLSPMTSFQSELGLDFKIQLEANHIIKDSQVWVGSLGQGPHGTSLMAVYRNLDSFAFQDELGQVVLQVCKTVPHGVLCFLPSYKVLDKLYNRWMSTGLLDKIGEKKKILREPRSSSKEDFEEQIVRYYRAVESTKDPDDAVDGAIMLAVCRGKISEGLDFADDFARAVISVGIPYPNFKDIQVELKRKYNDQHRHDRSLMSGSDWYDIQAFRALNQALGRCIRHRNDWGALIIIDERFVKSGPKYTKGLSKWIRNKVCAFDNYARGMDSLNEFILQRKKAEKEQKIDTSTPDASTPVTPKASSLDTTLHDSSNVNMDSDSNGKCYGSKTDSPAHGSPSFRQMTITNLKKPQVTPKSSLRQKDFPKLSSIATPSPKPKLFSIFTPVCRKKSNDATATTTTSHHLPTAVVHPSFVLPPKPQASLSTISNQLVAGNNHIRENTSHDPTVKAANTAQIDANSRPSQLSSNTAGIKSFEKNSNVISPNKSEAASITNSKHFSLRIITDIAPPGKRMQVFDISPNLHSMFGGNLNLPVSTTERLVYIVEPPQNPGGNPLARIIKMSEEQKEKLLTVQQQNQQQQLIVKETVKQKLSNESSSNESSLKIMMKTKQSSSSFHSNCETHSTKTSNFYKPLRGNALSDSSNLREGKIMSSNNDSTNMYNNSPSNGEILLSEEEATSSCSLFDSPITNPSKSVPDKRQQLTLNTSHTDTSQLDHENNSTTLADSTDTGSSKKNGNPLLKFLQPTTGASNNIMDATDSSKKPFTEPFNEGNCNSFCANTSTNSPISPDVFQTTNIEDEDIINFKTRKPLFKVNSTNTYPSNKTKHSIITQSPKVDPKGDVIHKSKINNVRRSVSKSLVSENINLELSPVVSQEKEEPAINLQVKRKCGRKRRSLSGKTQEEDNKKYKSQIDSDVGNVIQTNTSRLFQCLYCGGNFFDGKSLEASTFSYQKTPPFLRDTVGKEERKGCGSKVDCLFFHSNPGHGGLASVTQGQLEPKNKYIEEEDICVQFLYCSLCHSSQDQRVEPSGAYVILAASAGVRFNKGQLWLFSDALVK